MAAGKLMNPDAPTKQTVSSHLTETLARIARKQNITVAQLSLAWLLHRSPVLLPIPGTSKLEHLEENVAAASIKLDADQWRELESALAG
jgi:aryl-alcohol dehydrogenase-like predicted oxidoreductase